MPTRTIANGGGNWNSTGTWVEGAVPINGDTVVATATSGQLTVNVGSACTSIDFTNYTNTLTINQTLTVNGAVKLVTGMTITTTSGTPVLLVTTTATLTSGGKTWPYAMQFTGTTQTFTLADNWTVNGTLTMGNGTTQTINGFALNATGSVTIASTGAVAGTTVLNLTGTGTVSRTSTCVLRLATNINTAGTITISSLSFDGNTFTYVTAANVITTGSTLTITSVATTLNTNGMAWNNIALGTVTITLSSALTVNGNLTPGGSSAPVINGSTINLKGNYNPSGGASLTGTTNLIFNAAGSQTWVGGTSGTLRVNAEINCGTLVVSGVCVYGTGTLLYTAGTVDTSAGTLSLGTSCTLNLNGLIVNSLLLGAAGITATLASGIVISTSIAATAPTAASKSAFVSSSPGTQRVLTLQKGATCDLGFVNATDIDSSAGRPIYTRKGTLSNATNWKLLTEPKTISAGNGN